MFLYLSENVSPKFQQGNAHQLSQPCGDFSSMLLYLFDDVFSPLFRLTSLWMCAGEAPLLFVLKECLWSLGDHLQDLVVLSSSTSGDQHLCEIVTLCRPPPHQDWGRAKTAGKRFTRDDSELGPQLGGTVTRRTAS
jgi:hypothetical protein